MKGWLVVLSLAMVICGCGGRSKKEMQQDEQAVRNAASSYAEAFSLQDADALASLWTEDGLYINFTDHETVQGRGEIAKYFKEKFDSDGESKLKVSIDSVQVVDDEHAIEKGFTSISRKGMPEEKRAYESQYVKEDDTWLLHKRASIALVSPPSNFEHLKDLDWLVGTWVDADDDDTVNSKSTYKWDKNKNFLINAFSMTVLGQKELSGQVVIGWDTIEKKIRSWMFDSDGGFGQGVWHSDDDSWYVTVAYTLADGKRASATHVYKKIDSNTYTFSSQSRDIGGKIMPNIGPYKTVRAPAEGV